MPETTMLTYTAPPTTVSSATVLHQGFGFSPRHWTSRAPADFRLPAVLAGAPVRGKWPRVDRRTLLALPRPATPRDALDLYVAASAWGTGTKAQRVARCVKVLHEDEVGARLLSALPLLWSEGPSTAYSSMERSGRNKIKHLGPSFFTKVLYFGGYDRAAGGQQPLILDTNVVKGLNDLLGLGWHPAEQWPAQQYTEYLRIAEDLRGAWGWERTDQVEYALFTHGTTIG
ncbi:8-oxoguanine DNA glycosylase OGG fold protein [Georgenia yuyongxinii]